jgi:hypothetical protein
MAGVKKRVAEFQQPGSGARRATWVRFLLRAGRPIHSGAPFTFQAIVCGCAMTTWAIVLQTRQRLIQQSTRGRKPLPEWSIVAATGSFPTPSRPAYYGLRRQRLRGQQNSEIMENVHLY